MILNHWAAYATQRTVFEYRKIETEAGKIIFFLNIESDKNNVHA